MFALMRTEPRGPLWRSFTSASAASSSRKTGCRRASKAAPASVMATLRVVRCRSRTPIRLSSVRIRWLKVDGETRSSSAALRKLFCVATAANAVKSESSGRVSLMGNFHQPMQHYADCPHNGSAYLCVMTTEDTMNATTKVTTKTNDSALDPVTLVARLKKAGEAVVTGADQAEIDSYFDTKRFRFHAPDGFETDFDGLNNYFKAFRAAFDDRSIRRGIIVVQ